jgi:predicted nucleic acid-binding protein
LRVLFDTSVLVAAALKEHSHHSRALPWLKRAHGGDIEFFVCAHSLAEMYSALTNLPTRPRISPAQAWSLVQHNVKSAQVVELSVNDYDSTIQRVSGMGFSGGVIYDALIVRAAEKSKADHVLTLNERHFRRICPPDGSLLLIP